MSFRSITDIAKDVKARLVLLKVNEASEALLFRDVRIAAITSYEQLFEIIPHLSRFPAAVVCIGHGRFQDDYTVRQVNVGIMIVDKFRASNKDAAEGIWHALDRTQDSFLTDSVGTYVEIEGVTYSPETWRPITLKSSKLSAFLIEVETLNP